MTDEKNVHSNYIFRFYNSIIVINETSEQQETIEPVDTMATTVNIPPPQRRENSLFILGHTQLNF